KRCAIPRPIPRLAPVTSATRPANLLIGSPRLPQPEGTRVGGRRRARRTPNSVSALRAALQCLERPLRDLLAGSAPPDRGESVHEPEGRQRAERVPHDRLELRQP